MNIEDCIEEIIQVCNKHGVVLSHQDSHGAFQFLLKSEIEKTTQARSGRPMLEVYHEWLRDAEVVT